MNITSLRWRRLLTTLGVVAALALGFGSIRAAAAWTAASAPIDGRPDLGRFDPGPPRPGAGTLRRDADAARRPGRPVRRDGDGPRGGAGPHRGRRGACQGARRRAQGREAEAGQARGVDRGGEDGRRPGRLRRRTAAAATAARGDAMATMTVRAMTDRRPVHLAVLVGASAGAYAISLAGVTALQSATDAPRRGRRGPASHAVDIVASGHDGLQTSIDGDAARIRRRRRSVCGAWPSPGRHGDVARPPRPTGRQGHRGGGCPARARQPAAVDRLDADRHPNEGRSTPRREPPAERSAARRGPRSAVAERPDRIHRFEASAMASPLRLTVCRRGGDVGRATGRSTPPGPRSGRSSRRRRPSCRDSATSDLTRLNLAAGSGRPVDVPRRLERALVAADRAHRVTGGRFDPRVLRDLDRLGYPGAALGGPSRIAGRGRRPPAPASSSGRGAAGWPVVARRPRRDRQGAHAPLGGGTPRPRGVARYPARGRAATWSPAGPGPTADLARRHRGPGRWDRAARRDRRRRPARWRRRRSGSGRGSMTGGPSTTCSTHGPANPPRPGCGR